MASLTGQTISNTYDGLLKTTDNDVLGATSKEITDGLGNGSGVSLDTNGNIVAQGTATVNGLHVNSTGAVEMPAGTDGERPTAVAGMLRFNTTTNGFEGYDGVEWGAIGGSSGSEVNVNNFNGNNSTTVFTLSQSVDNENVTQVYIDGIYQQKDTYSVVGATITFSEAPPTGTNNIEVASFTTVQVDTIPDDIVTYAKLGAEFTTTGVLGGNAIDFAAAQIFTKTLTADTTFTFSNVGVGMVKDLIITGSFVPTFPAGSKIVAGTYNGAVSNLIQVVVAASGDYWLSISQAI